MGDKKNTVNILFGLPIALRTCPYRKPEQLLFLQEKKLTIKLCVLFQIQNFLSADTLMEQDKYTFIFSVGLCIETKHLGLLLDLNQQLYSCILRSIRAVLTLVVQGPSAGFAVSLRESIGIHLLPPFCSSPSISPNSLHIVTASYLDAKESTVLFGPRLLFGLDIGGWWS